MFWYRNVRATVLFGCCYMGNMVMPKKAERKVFITQKYSIPPRGNLISWANHIVKKTVLDTGYESCDAHQLDVCEKIDIVDIEFWEEKPEEMFVTGVVFRIIRQRNRGQWHIYGLTDKQYFDKMSEKGFTQNQSREMLKLFKEGKIKTKAKV